MSWPAAPPAGWRERADRAVARGRRWDRLIPSVLLDSRVSRAGAWYGTAVGWLWGGVWSTGRVERANGLWVFRGMPPRTFRRGGVCVGSCFLTGDDAPSERVLRHEAVHARQWQRYGLLMPLLYALAGQNPLRNRFEIEAGLADGNYIPRDAA
ncbi:hypothetical protein GCM10022240_20060 [Microbacterium kribbense]|uniref:Fe-S oxidoreductase n=1 Tax=Microbacterium kribbense TaxID=433645 RepID=A0ABP7GJ63_9MICO